MAGAPNYFPKPRTLGSVSALTLTPGKSDYASDLQDAVNQMLTGTLGRLELAPSASPYPVSKTIEIPANPCGYLYFNGNGATLRATMPMESLIRFPGATGMGTFTVENLRLDAAGRAAYGIIGTRVNLRTGLVRDVSVRGARRSGFWLQLCQATVFESCSASQNRQYGFLLEGCSSARFLGCSAQSNGLDGFRIASLNHKVPSIEPFGDVIDEQTGPGPELVACVSSDNGRDGISIGRPPLDGYSKQGSWLLNTTLSNATISANGRHGLRLLGDAYGVLVTGSSITPGTKTVTWASAAYVDPRQNTVREVFARVARGIPLVKHVSPVLTLVDTPVTSWPQGGRWTLLGDVTTPTLKLQRFGASTGWTFT